MLLMMLLFRVVTCLQGQGQLMPMRLVGLPPGGRLYG